MSRFAEIFIPGQINASGDLLDCAFSNKIIDEQLNQFFFRYKYIQDIHTPNAANAHGNISLCSKTKTAHVRKLIHVHVRFMFSYY